MEPMERTAVSAGAYVHHLQLLSPQPAEMAKFYGKAMDMQVATMGDAWLCRGPGRRVLIAQGPAKSAGYFGFACRDRDGLTALRERAKRENLEILESPSPLFTEAFA